MPINSRSLITGLCLALFVLNPVFAQMTVTGSISGLVTDPSGEMVAGAAITLTSELTGESRSTRRRKRRWWCGQWTGWNGSRTPRVSEPRRQPAQAHRLSGRAMPGTRTAPF